MTDVSQEPNRRILAIDDNPGIHEDFRKILCAEHTSSALDATETALFGQVSSVRTAPRFEFDSAYQGQAGVALVRKALRAGRPYAMAFVDVRMPPGWDGIETTLRLWKEDPDLLVVICTVYSDYSWDEMAERLGVNDRVLILKKPFDGIEVRQLAGALTEKWTLARTARIKLDEVERIVQDRTRSLERTRDELRASNEQLATARDAAEAANESKSAFLANISHEIRTPLTSILGFAELIGDPDRLASDHADSIETIQRNGACLLQILDDILDLSKIEAGKMAVERIPCDPVAVARDVVSLMQVQARRKDLDLRFERDGAVPATIESDPTRLRQILMNLIGNAIKFTDEGSVQVVTRVAAPADGGAWQLQYDVIDTGMGLSLDEIDGLFKPFVQGDISMTRTFGGAGLGLTISRRLARALGGDITVESRLGEGSTFRATVSTGALDGAAKEDDAEAARAPTRGGLRPEAEPLRLDARILLAEDGPDNQRLISAILRRAGADVTVAENGKIAVDKVLAEPFDLIVMDMQMPELDGYGATRQLRQKGVALPIIALTAHTMASDRQKCIDAGCDDYLTKPIDRKALIRTLSRHLGAAEPTADLPSVPDTEGGDCHTEEEPGTANRKETICGTATT